MAEVRAALKAAVDDLRAAFPSLVLGEIDIFRGDSWQLLLAEPGKALRAAVAIRAGLKARTGRDTRVAIGIGPAQDIDLDRISASTGEAFLASGRMLDEMGRKQRIALAPSPATRAVMGWMPVMLDLAEVIIGGWRPKRAEVSALALLHPDWTGEKLSEVLTERRPEDVPITQQGVSDHLQNGDFSRIRDLVLVFESQRWDWHSD